MAKILLNGVWCDDYLPGPRITQFARCGCTQTCACVIQAGDCITVTGNGGSNTPYTIGYTQGCAKILTEDTNTVDLEGDGSTGNPLTGRVKRVGDNLGPLNSTPGGGANLLKENTGPDGLYVSCEDIQDCVGAAVQAVAGDCLTYNDVANSISVSVCPTDNGLECTSPGDEANCPDGGLLVRPSSDAGNGLDFGSDGRLYAAGAAGGVDVLDTPCINMTRTGSGTQADPYIISAAPIIAPEPNGGLDCSPTGLVISPSDDLGNALVYGTDGSLFVPAAATGCPTSNSPTCLTFTADPVTGDCVADLIIAPEPNALECGPNGLFVPPSCPVSDSPTCLTFTTDPVTGECVADLIIAPPCNLLTCDADGLRVRPQRADNATTGMCGAIFGINGNDNTTIIAQTCINLDITGCTLENVFAWVEWQTISIRHDSGTLGVVGDVSFDNGATWAVVASFGSDAVSPGFGQVGTMGPFMRIIGVNATGDVRTFCVRIRLDAQNVVNGSVASACQTLMMIGLPG